MTSAVNGKVIQSRSVEGRVRYMRSSSDDRACACCPDGKGHVFSRSVDFDQFATGLPEHFGRGAEEFLYSVALRGGYEGKRVRLTVEILED